MNNSFVKIQRIWDSNVEQMGLEILKELINTEHYEIHPHVLLKDIFFSKSKQPWSDFHVDFIITDKKGLPVLGIELNGKEHWNNPNVQEHDKIEKELFFEFSVPLIIIPIVEMTTYPKNDYREKIDVYKKELRLLLINHLVPFYYPTAYPIYCWSCDNQYEYKYRNDYTDSFYHCTNQKCSNCINEKTISMKYIYPLLSDFLICFINDIKNTLCKV